LLLRKRKKKKKGEERMTDGDAAWAHTRISGEDQLPEMHLEHSTAQTLDRFKRTSPSVIQALLLACFVSPSLSRDPPLAIPISRTRMTYLQPPIIAINKSCLSILKMCMSGAPEARMGPCSLSELCRKSGKRRKVTTRELGLNVRDEGVVF
jgi:hypothetical protein